ncbi:MAG: hypothetical protein WC047_02025 [Kiritimatiellales bacterium]
MKLKNITSILGVLLILTGCSSVSQQRATVADGAIQNASLGFFGFMLKIPEGFEVYNPAAKNPAEYNELQQMAVRIYKLNRAYHPRGNELFYESFLLMSEKTCFLLVTLKSEGMPLPDSSPFSDEPFSQWPLLPLYNVTSTRSFELGANRQDAVYTCGSAYEQKGWYYAGAKRNSTLFSYETCKITGGNRDSYILMGFALPENAAALAAPMKQMIDGMKL